MKTFNGRDCKASHKYRACSKESPTKEVSRNIEDEIRMPYGSTDQFLNTVGDKDQNRICQNCLKTFSSGANMMRHMKAFEGRDCNDTMRIDRSIKGNLDKGMNGYVDMGDTDSENSYN